VYVGRAEKPRYRGHVQRIEVFLTANSAAVPRVAVRFHRPEGSFAFVAEGPSAASLVSRQRKYDLSRYVFLSATGQKLEFRERLSGGPALPFSFRLQPDAILPVCLDEQGRFLRQTMFLWDSFTLQETGAAGSPPEPSGAKVLVLCDDLLVGTSRNFRDVDGRRITGAEFRAKPNLDYTYRPHDRQDLARMLAAGFNYFDRVLPEQLEYLFDKPAWFDLLHFSGHARPVFPEILFHPGFQGVEDFLDEPAYIYSEDFDPGPEVTLEEMARLQQKRTRDEYDRVARGRQPGLMRILREAGVLLEGGELVEPPFPIWEEFHSTACYQLHVPVSGFIQEGRYQHPGTVDLLNYSFRTRLPRRPETMFRFYFALLRGAARMFDKDWGMSIYGQADPPVSLLGMTMAYDRGARWIYFWSSDRDHHLPFEEQLALAQGLSDHVKTHPRPPRHELIRQASDAIVLPYGFTFGVSDWQKARLPGLWHRNAFPIEAGTMEDGTPYYSVLRCAAEEMERLLAEDREFDIVIDVPQLKSAGYANLHDVLPRARLARYDFLWSIRRPYYFVLAALVLFLIVFRTYRIIRWVRRRSRRDVAQPQKKE
jgi:hypothetical protein